MHIWVDADACPKAIRDILFRASMRSGIPLVLVANSGLSTPSSPLISSIQVAGGLDAADHEIVRRAGEGDLVITADIPLAAEVIDLGALALSPRGELYDRSNVRARLNMRDFMETLRAGGVHSGGPPALGKRERQAFANQLDRWIAGSMD